MVTRRRWGVRRRRPRPGLRRRLVGVPGRADRRAHLLPDHDPSQIPEPGGARLRSGTAASGSGAGSRSASCGGLVPCAAPQLARVYGMLNAVAPALLVAQSIGRIGNYFNQELFGKPSTLPWALKIAPDDPPVWILAVRHLPADVPLRDHLEPAAGGVAGVAGQPRPRCGHRGCSRSTLPATQVSASSRRRCGSTTRSTSSGCA